MTRSVLEQRARTTLYLDTEGDEPIVYKVLRDRAPSATDLASFYNELTITRGLDIEGIRPALRRERVDGLPALALAYVAGQPLSNWTVRQPDHVQEALSIAVEITATLERVHEAGVIHKDLNPSNLIYDSASRRVTLIDFGLATRFDTKAPTHATTSLEGTLRYIAPEQTGRIDRTVDHRADLYSLGATLYQLFVGKPPFALSDPLELVHAHIARQPVPPHEASAHVPASLSRVIMRMLEKNPEDRYQSARGARADLAVCLSSLQQSGEIPRFELGRADVPSGLNVPEKLYGREAPIATLVATWERADAGRVELALIRGPGGVGKSSVARAVRSAAALPSVLYVEGKCAQGAVPYLAFGRALDAVITTLRSESEARWAETRERLRTELGTLGKLLAPIVPNAEAIFDDLSDPLELGDEESDHRFQFVFRTFVRALCQPERLLVIFLDDLQWAGPESLALIESLVTDPAGGHLVIVGAHRAEATAGLDAMREALAERRCAVTEIELQPLGIDPILALLCQTLGANAEAVESLATLVARKTQGNPFAIRQFLNLLFAEDIIRFDVERHCWDWDAAKAAEAHIDDSVVDMLTRNLERLPEPTIDCLRRAACAGHQFRLEAIAALRSETPKETSWALAPAVTAGLVQPLGSAARVIGVDADDDAYLGATLAFAHDRLHEAALTLASDQERTDTRLQLGRWLRDGSDEPTSPERTFEIVGHLNAALELITDPAERAQLVRLNLEASRIAMRSAANLRALGWLQQAHALLPEDAWEADRELALAITTELAEAAYLANDPEALSAAAAEVDQHARSPEERTRVVIACVKSLMAADDLSAAIELGLGALEELGIRFPKRPGVPHLILATLSVKWALLRKPVAALAHQEEMTDARMLSAIPILEKVAPAVFREGGKLYPLLVLRIVQLTARYGAVPASAFGYGGYALTLAGVLGDVEGGYAYGTMAKALAERFDDDRCRGSAIIVFEMFIRHWKEPLTNCLDPLLEGWRLSASTGRVFEAAWAQCYRLLWMEAAGVELASVRRNLASWRHAMSGDRGAERMALLLGRFVACMQGEAPSPTDLSGGDYDEAETLEHGDETELAFFHQYKLRLALLFHDRAATRVHAEELEARLEALTSMPMDPIARMYIALARLLDGDDRPIRRAIGKLRKWERHCEENYGHKRALLEAELAAHRGRHAEARVAYDRAVRGARKHGFLHEEAFALTCCARFYEERASSLAGIVALDAARAWKQLGAHAMVEGLGHEPRPSLLPAAASSTLLQSDSDSDHGSVDLTTIVRSAAAVGSELQMQKLLARLLEILLQNAGADRALLFLATGGGLMLEAETSTEGVTQTLGHVPLIEARNVCVPVVRHVERNREPLRVTDASADPDLANDPHVRESGVRSLLCVPFLASGKVHAVAYLENHVTAGAFTAANVETLSLLASQVVFSLQNARLYGELEEAFEGQVALTRASDRFVPQDFIERIGHSTIVDVALGDSVRKEMSVMFTDVRGFTSLMEGLEEGEDIHLVNTFLRHAEPAILNNSGFVVEYLGDAILALFESADQVVRAGVEMRRTLPALNARRRERGAPTIEFGIGANTDRLTLGVIGGEERIKAGVLGDGVNLAARVESLTKHYRVGMLISGKTRDRLVDPSRWRLRTIDLVQVMGRSEDVELVEVYDADPAPLREAKDRSLESYQAGWAAYREGELTDAEAAFERCREALPDDHTVAMLLERCARHRDAPRAAWTGVEVLDFK